MSHRFNGAALEPCKSAKKQANPPFCQGSPQNTFILVSSMCQSHISKTNFKAMKISKSAKSENPGSLTSAQKILPTWPSSVFKLAGGRPAQQAKQVLFILGTCSTADRYTECVSTSHHQTMPLTPSIVEANLDAGRSGEKYTVLYRPLSSQF